VTALTSGFFQAANRPHTTWSHTRKRTLELLGKGRWEMGEGGEEEEERSWRKREKKNKKKTKFIKKTSLLLSSSSSFHPPSPTRLLCTKRWVEH
jgi:hypothetical protein